MPVANASPATSLRSAWGRDAAFVLLLAGCGGSSTTLPPEIHLTVAPTTLSLVAGATATLTATLTGTTGALAWSSSATSIATVDQSGLVTAVSAGTATITVALSGQSGVTATCAVTVTAPPTSVAVTAITQNGQAVNLSNLQGGITVALDVNIPAGVAGTVEAYLDDKLIGSAEVPATSGAASGDLSLRRVRTVSVDASTVVTTLSGESLEVNTANGDYDLLAKLKVGGVVAATTGATPVSVHNMSALVIRGTPGAPSTLDPSTGETIYAGDVLLDVFVAPFDPTESISHADLTLDLAEPSGRPHIAPMYGSDLVAGTAHLILRHDQTWDHGGLSAIGEGKWKVAAAIATGASGQRPVVILNDVSGLNGLPVNSWRLDYLAPAVPAGGMSLRTGSTTAWVNQATNFQQRLAANGFSWSGAGATVTDYSGVADCTLSAGPSYDNPFWPHLQTGADLGAETATANLVFWSTCTDKVGNSVTIHLTNGFGVDQILGVDNTLPTVQFLASLNNEEGIHWGAANPAAGTPLFLSGADLPSGGGLGSGLDPAGFNLAGLLHYPNVTPEASCFYGTWNGSACLPNLQLEARYVPMAPPVSAEVEWQLTGRDLAGNLSTTRSLKFVNDAIAPTTSGFSGQFLHDGDNAYDLSYLITDNLRVTKAAIGIQYDGYPYTVVFGNTDVSKRFDPAFTVSYNYQRHFDAFPTALEQSSLQGNGYYYPNGVKHLATNILYGGSDGAGNSAANLWSLSGSYPLHDRFASFRVGSTGMDRIDLGGPYIICSNPYGAHGDCQGVPTSFQAWVDTYFHAGGVNPVQHAYFGKLTNFGNQALAVVSATPAVATLMDYGSYYVNHYAYTFDECDLPAGDYDVGFWMDDGNGNVFATRTTKMTVTLAVKF